MPTYSPVDDQSRQKRTHAKVRTGCVTCKSRRIKCDEVKPACSRCRLSDRKCVYSVPKAWLFQPEKPTRTLHEPPSITLGTRDERRALDFFRQNTGPQFAGHHDLAGRFWNAFIPQTATSDMLIFKLAVAMGAQHEAVIYGSGQARDLSSRTHSTVISTLARNLTNLRVDISLLCCAMLMAYANLCEEVPVTAPVHFCLGLKILREETIPGHRGLADPMTAMIEPMFGELELATAMFCMPAEDIDVLLSATPTYPNLPEEFGDLYQAKQYLSDILRWLLYVTYTYRSDPPMRAAKSAEADTLFAVWRQTVARYSLRIAATYPGLFLKARKMLFQYKLFGTCRLAANNPIFAEASRVQLISIDFSREHMTSVLCTLKRSDVDENWRPLGPASPRDRDDLDIWPQGEPVGHDGTHQIVRITIGR